MENKEFSKKRPYGVKENTITRRITKTEYSEFKNDEEKRKKQLLQKLAGSDRKSRSEAKVRI